MIRQAHTYLVGAFGGVTLIAIAIGVFVVLVGAQVFHDWPIADLGSHSPKAAVAPAKALSASDTAAAAGGSGATARTAHSNATKAGAGTAAATAKRAHHHAAADSGAVADVRDPSTVVEPTASTGGDESSGGSSGSYSSHPSSSSTSQSSSPSGGSGGSSGSSGSGSTATASSGSSGSSGLGSNSGTGTVTSPVTAATKPAQAVTEAVNETVKGVDEKVLGGTLEKTSVTEVTENVVNGVAGPESVVGKTVEGVGEVVGGLLNPGGH